MNQSTREQMKEAINQAVQRMYQRGTVPEGMGLVSQQTLATYRQVLRNAAVSEWHKNRDTGLCVAKLWNLGYHGRDLRW